MVSRYLARCIAGALIVGMSLVGSGMATGQTTTQVLSDKVAVTGTITSGPGGFTFRSTSCTLTSDVEGSTTTVEGPTACQQVTSIVHQPDGSWVFNTVIVSPADGLIAWTFRFSGDTNNEGNMRNMMAHASGSGTEYDNPEPGMPPPPGYPVTVNGSFTLRPASGGALNVTGTETVYEAADAP